MFKLNVYNTNKIIMIIFYEKKMAKNWLVIGY